MHLRKSELNSLPGEEPKELFLMEGEPLSLSCKSPMGYPKPTIFWIIQSNTAYLHNITDYASEDAPYTCSATSMFRNEYKLENRIILKVVATDSSVKNEVPPIKLYVSPPNIPLVALIDQKLELNCIFGGTPLPEIVWSKKGCSLRNNCINAPNNTNGVEDETASVECVAGGISAHEVKWFTNGVPLKDVKPNPRRRLDNSANIMTIDVLKKFDTAVFQCNASNIQGYVFRDFYLVKIC
ncbi:neuroglian [Nephila pilipes]|uniref:Neuroglian n=1 Tax=Nephila pilipes TaxID=299642 RepID=A0A8X6IAT5_NEPPI|nr:neuroglian [Nephila pilipes]